ncbi:ABC transporter substrate-binding protein [Cupriavidus gilardii]|uniref:ABC transporter substrate-binding protein n=1 Tax=Cupriavidus gilardii TaxID=82541 RepID=UPI0021BFE4A8|nr:ABC transporter substrate-binding protein [Cupriavidus gilardii]MCT9118506.1 ABC transporter substrate-binding protein [Cupriavidus gilardii]
MNTSALRLAAMLIATCTAGAFSGGALGQQRGGTLTIGTEAEFSGFNHLTAKIFNQNTAAPASSVMETLFAYEGKQIVPRLGLALQEAPDRMSATVTLRKNVKFHDGTLFNAEAVAFHYNRLLAPDSGVNVSMIAPVKTVEVVDEHTVRFVLKHPWTALRSALALEGLTNFIGSPTALRQDPAGFHRKPIGTGPFVFKEWQAGDRIVMERNPAYWDSRLPYLDRVIYRVLPDANTRYQSIRSGEVDIGRMDTATHVLDAKKDPSLKVHSYEGSGAISWNFNNSKPPFDDKRVRAAVVHAFNSQAMVDTFFLGTTQPTRDLLGANSEWHCPNLTWRSYDLARAKALVKEVGKPISFELVSTNTPAGRRQAAMVQQFVKAAGMDARIRLVEQSQNVRVGLSGDYQMDVWRFSDIGGDPDLVLSYYFGGEAGEPVSRHDTSQVDPLLAKARIETDRAKRHAMYCEVAQKVSDEAFQLIPVRVTYFAIARPTVKGLPPMQNSLIRVRAMWLDKPAP